MKKIELSSGFKRYFANTSWMLGEKVLRMGTSLIVGVWVARYLGPEQFGLLSYAIAFSALFGPIVTLGLDGIVVRELVNNPENSDEILGTAFFLKTIAGVVTWGIVAATVYLFPPDDPTGLWMILIISGGFLFQSFDVINFNFRANVQSKYTSLVNGASLLIVSLFKVALILSNASVVSFAVLGALELLLTAVGLLLAYRFHGNNVRCWRFTVKRGKALLNDSWPAIFAGLSVMLYMRLDQIMLGQMLGDEAVGLYSAVVRISEAWYFIPMVIVQSLLPSIVRSRQNNEKLYYQRLQKLFYMLVVISYLVAIPMIFLSGFVIDLLYGSAYAPAANVLTIHIWAGIFVSLGLVSGSWYVAENLIRLSMYRALLGAVINIVMNIFLIDMYGIIGAAVSTVISYGASAWIFNAFVSRTRVVFHLQTKALLLGCWKNV